MLAWVFFKTFVFAMKQDPCLGNSTALLAGQDARWVWDFWNFFWLAWRLNISFIMPPLSLPPSPLPPHLSLSPPPTEASSFTIYFSKKASSFTI